jgi:hypothetical protein
MLYFAASISLFYDKYKLNYEWLQKLKKLEHFFDHFFEFF